MPTAVEKELNRNSEYQRVLAELSPAEKRRLLGNDFDLQRELAKKKEYRRTLASLSPAQKLRLLEQLRDRSQIQRGLKRSATPSLSSRNETLEPKCRNGRARSIQELGPARGARSFGGRATSSGVNYEVQVAASIAVKMLSGDQTSVWDGISGSGISAITMQAPEAVDDIVVALNGEPEASIFISAKKRSGPIALTKRNSTYRETIEAFVIQFLKLSPLARPKSRLVWAIPSSGGRAATHDLASALKSHRLDSGDLPLLEFLRGRSVKEKRTLRTLIDVATKTWTAISGNPPNNVDLRHFLRLVYLEIYDFEAGHHTERQAETEIRANIVANPKQATRAWETLEHFFAQADQRGIRVTSTSLRRRLAERGLSLKLPPDYAKDIAYLQDLTARNQAILKQHTELRFASGSGGVVHLPRIEELTALIEATKHGSLLLTGEPGCGKSGIVHELVAVFEREKFPVVLLLAEEIFGSEWRGAANLPGLLSGLDEVLTNWPAGRRGFLITDALDAVRDAETQMRLRNLLRSVQHGTSGWTVIASVREFDLKYGRELREAFPGSGVKGHSTNEFPDVAHFHLKGLSERELDELISQQSKIQPFIEGARKNTAKSAGMHRSPFYLRLAADLLRHGETPARLADWVSPAVLLRSFWTARVTQGADVSEREVVLRSICQRMVEARRMTISLKELSLGAPARNAIKTLRGIAILQPPTLRRGSCVGEDELRFTHHLLHDYAIARSLIPETPDLFCEFASHDSLLPIFYRQSFLFALEEIWDGGRDAFWNAALRLETVASLHGITRILAPILAARRVEIPSDLLPLRIAVDESSEFESAGQKALRHLASGLQDTDVEMIRAGAIGWSTFAKELATSLPRSPAIEGPLTHILARLNAIHISNQTIGGLELNMAGRSLLTYHSSKQVAEGWRYAGLVAIETIARTYTLAPWESESALLLLLAPKRLANFPHNDLYDLARNLTLMGNAGDGIALKLFGAAFASEPQHGQWEERGTPILGMRFQTSDEWNLIHYVLADYYEKRKSENPPLMTEAACIAWNAVVRRRESRNGRIPIVLAKISFRGVQCNLIEDFSHIWNREFENEENRIISHFELLLRRWAGETDPAHLDTALDRFAACNRTSLLWNILMEAGAEFPSTLGHRLEGLLHQPIVLTHPDYAYAGTKLFGSLHKVMNRGAREQLEKLIIELPQSVPLREQELREPTPSRIKHAQNRLLGALEEPNIVLEAVRALARERRAESPLPSNEKRPRLVSGFVKISEDEALSQQGLDPTKPTVKEMVRLRDALKPLLERDNKAASIETIESHWPALLEAKKAVRRYGHAQPLMTQELWGHLVSACEIISRRAQWPRVDTRWVWIRNILLKASEDPVPIVGLDEDSKEDRWPSWGWPSPRLDAARGLPFVALHIGKTDKAISKALRRLVRDKSFPLRFNLADRLAVLSEVAPKLMWELIDLFIAEEAKFSVLDGLLQSLNHLWKDPAMVKARLGAIAKRAQQSASEENHIHETLAHIYLFQYLRSGDPDCERYIASLIPECDIEPAHKALSSQLHGCRVGGWLTAGNIAGRDTDSDIKRARTWKFFQQLLSAAQERIQTHRNSLNILREKADQTEGITKPIQDRLSLAVQLVDAIAAQLFFASGAFEKSNTQNNEALSAEQIERFWQEASPLFHALASEYHPHTAHQLVQTLSFLLPIAADEIFLLATKSIQSSAKAGFQHDSLAAAEVVKLIQRALADHREIFRGVNGQESECLAALLRVLDLFVEAGWGEARQLTHRLEEIYR